MIADAAELAKRSEVGIGGRRSEWNESFEFEFRPRILSQRQPTIPLNLAPPIPTMPPFVFLPDCREACCRRHFRPAPL